MAHISLIAAVAQDGAIGKQQQLLCHLPADLKHFKQLTLGHTIVMGRKTFESLPKGALPGRTNVVITRNPALTWDNVHTVATIDEALATAGSDDELFVIGGATIYEQTIERAHTLYITHIHHTFDGADTFFPAIDPAKWQEVEREEVPAHERNPYPCAFVTYRRR